ncbi:MAG: hypothetical protein IJV31_10055 [Clostridia bacterium]|nr:hypothetical protein [Clostridia bacterium]
MNYQYNINNFAIFEEHIERSARKNFHNPQKYNFEFIKLDSTKVKDIE